MHTIALREEFYEKNPWVAQSLCKAFSEAKSICEETMYKYSALKYMVAWSVAAMEEERELFGDDLWPYGLKSNTHVLETLVQYSYEQGLIKKQLDVKSLFAPNTLEDFKV
jgi:4,5-dihydroxyphthalate decarboxylase